jgi:hypothetical protein
LLLIRGILAALRQIFHLPACPNLADHLSGRGICIKILHRKIDG